MNQNVWIVMLCGVVTEHHLQIVAHQPTDMSRCHWAGRIVKAREDAA